MLLTEARERYVQYRVDSGFARSTTQNDRSALDRLIRSIDVRDVRKITASHMDTFFGGLVQSGLASGTINAIQASLSAFFRWCRSRGILKPDVDPIAGRRYRPKEPKPQTRIHVSQFPVLLDGAANPRDRMLIAAGLYLLGRQSEITNIRIRDVDLNAGEILMIIKKTHQTDLMPITVELREELARWLTVYQELAGPLQPNWYLVPAVYRIPPDQFRIKPLGRITRPEDIMRRSVAPLGITEGRIGMHLLRRSSARAIFDELCKQGYDGALRRVSAWLHHSSTTITEHYLGLDLDRAQRDSDSKGKVLFPSLRAENVIQLERGARFGEADGVAL